MPLPLLAHQAPILPLKLWRPAAFNGTALVLGSIAPDLEYLLNRAPRASGFGHTLASQFLFCLPVTLLVVLLVGHLRLGEVVAARFARLRWLGDAATDVTKDGGLFRAFASALCGSFSHLALDALTHEFLPRWLPVHVFHVGHLSAATPTVVQLVVSGLGVVVSVGVLRRMSMQSTTEAPARRPGTAWLVLCAALGVTLGVQQAMPAIRHPDWYFDAGRLYVWGHTAFFVACGLVAGVLLGAVPLAVWDRRSYGSRTSGRSSPS